MITTKDIECAQSLEREAFELANEANSLHTLLMCVVHDTARKSAECVREEFELASKKGADPVRVAYVRAKSSALRGRMKLQLSRAMKGLASLRAQAQELSDKIDLGPLLDACPE